MNDRLLKNTQSTRRIFISSLSAVALLHPRVFADSPKITGWRVFVMAHSFHYFVAERLQALADAAGIKGHRLAGKQILGSSQVIQHWNLPDDKNTAKQALRDGAVDILTMSPNWNLPDAGIEKFVRLGLEHNPRLRVVVQLSWMPWDGWLPEERVPDNEARDTRPLDIVRAANMRWKEQLEPQLRALNAALGREVIHAAPVGDAVLKLRELVSAGEAPGLTRQTNLFADQIGHPKAPIVVLATYCIFACLYGMSPIGLADAEPSLDKLSIELKPLLQRIAWETVIAYPMSGVRDPAAK